MILACIPFRIMGDTDTEEAILVFAVPGSWFLLMFFAGAIRLTGPFVTMIYSMITGDMFTFGIIYLIVLFGFSQAFYFLYKGRKFIAKNKDHLKINYYFRPSSSGNDSISFLSQHLDGSLSNNTRRLQC